MEGAWWARDGVWVFEVVVLLVVVSVRARLREDIVGTILEAVYEYGVVSLFAAYLRVDVEGARSVACVNKSGRSLRRGQRGGRRHRRSEVTWLPNPVNFHHASLRLYSQ